MSSEYKKTVPHKQRVIENNNIKDRHPNRIPVVVERSRNCTKELSAKEDLYSKSNPDFKPKKKYLVPPDLTVLTFLNTLKKGHGLDDQIKVYLYIGNVIVDSDSTFKFLYEKNKHTDGFLYVRYSDCSSIGKKLSGLRNSLNPWGVSTKEPAKKIPAKKPDSKVASEAKTPESSKPASESGASKSSSPVEEVLRPAEVVGQKQQAEVKKSGESK